MEVNRDQKKEIKIVSLKGRNQFGCREFRDSTRWISPSSDSPQEKEYEGLHLGQYTPTSTGTGTVAKTRLQQRPGSRRLWGEQRTAPVHPNPHAINTGAGLGLGKPFGGHALSPHPSYVNVSEMLGCSAFRRGGQLRSKKHPSVHPNVMIQREAGMTRNMNLSATLESRAET